MKVIYFDEGEFEMKWENLKNNNEEIEFISIKSFEELDKLTNEIDLENTMFYTIPSQARDWMSARLKTLRYFGYMVVGPNRGKSLSSWIDKNKDKLENSNFTSFGNSVMNAHEVVGKVLG